MRSAARTGRVPMFRPVVAPAAGSAPLRLHAPVAGPAAKSELHPPMAAPLLKTDGEGCTLLLAEEIEEPRRFRLVKSVAQDASPGTAGVQRPHKYLLRVPTGRPKPRWRYYYNIPGQGLVTSENVQAGARFAGQDDEGRAGHWHVFGTNAGRVFLTHVGAGGAKGRSKVVDHSEFAKMINQAHTGAINEVRQRRHGEIREALGALAAGQGGAKQGDRVRKLVEHAHRQGMISPEEREGYLKHAEKGEEVRQHQQAQQSPAERALASIPARYREQLRAYMEGRTVERQGGVRDGGKGLRGRDASLFVADESGHAKKQPARYRLIEADELVTSHDSQSFQPRKDYPEGLQERVYHKSKAAQQEVIQHARHLQPELVITDNPDAAHGPPIVTPGGIALGGNSRGMTLQTAYRDYPEAADRYRKELENRAGHFGFSAQDVQGMKHPILVREVDAPKDKAEAVDLVRRYNESFTREMDPRADQIARAKRVGGKTMAALRDGLGTDSEGKPVDETWNDYLDSPRSKDLIHAMMQEGVLDLRNVDKYVGQKGSKAGLLNEEGKAYVGKLLLGKVVDDHDVLENMGQSAREKLIPHLPHILRAGEANPAYNLNRAVKTAASALAEMRQRKLHQPSDLLKNREMVNREGQAEQGDHPVFRDHLSRAVLAALWGKGQNELGPGFRAYADKAERAGEGGGGANLFGEQRDHEADAKAGMKEAFDFDTDDPIKEVESDREEEAKLRAQLKAQKARKKMAAAWQQPAAPSEPERDTATASMF